MKLYVYCLAEKIDASAIPVSGISGARVEVRQISGFSLLVSEFESDAPPPVTRENALAHAAVVSSVLKETTPLPFRFGTVADEEQLRNYLTLHQTGLETNLARVRGCVEMSVKIISHTDLEMKDSDDTAPVNPGTRFLEEKRRKIRGTEAAKLVAAWLKDQVATYVRQEDVTLCPTEKLIVAAAHLVAREQVAEYRERLAEARKTRPELHFLVSGPWPPYTFSNIELEFKTRFGVS